MYNLQSDGITDLVRYTQLLDLRKIIRDPLSGAIDGSNTVFTGNYPPALASGSTAVFIGTVPQTGYTFISDSVQFTLSSAPPALSSQLYANYTYSSLDASTVDRILFLGFDEMESRWARGLRLSSSDASYVAATETDAAAYIVGSSSVADPTSSGLYFSTSRKQIALYMKCCQYGYYSQRMYEEAVGGMSYREAGGMAVNTEMRAKNLKMLLDALDRDIDRLVLTAQADWLQNEGLFAAAIHSPQSGDYRENFRWQDSPSTLNGASSANPDGQIWNGGV